MKRKNTTRHALFMSILSLLLCVSMLVGTTFAWFTDEVKSGINTITAGNLDIELEYSKDFKSWDKVQGKSDLFSDELWEPGHTEVVYLKLSNLGTLALKYNLGINIDETEGTNVDGKTFKLSDSIYMGVVENVTAAYATRDAAAAAVANTSGIIGAGYNKSGSMNGKTANGAEELYLAVVVYMPTTVGNEANYLTGTEAPVIDLGIRLFATQLESELDSFGSDYDKGAAWTGGIDTDWYFNAEDNATEYTISSAEELAGLAALVNGTATAPATTFAAEASNTVKDDFKGKTIKLGANINLNDIEWTPIGDNPNPFLGNFDGQNFTVSNLRVNNSGWAGLIGHAGKSAGSDIKNVKIDGAVLNSNRMTGAVVGQLYGSIDNCHVNDAHITVIPNAVDGGYDNGDKVGGVVGWLGDNGNNRTLTNCTVTNSELSAYRDVGGIAGYVASSTSISNNSVSNVSITVDQLTNHYGEKDANAGAIYGRTGGAVTDSNNTDTNVTFSITYLKDGLILKDIPETEEVVLHSIPVDYPTAEVKVPEGVTTLRSEVFTTNLAITEVTIPSSVTDFGGLANEAGTGASGGAFKKTNVEKITLPDGMIEIPAAAFNQASKLKEVNIPASVKTIGINAFAYTGLTELKVPDTIDNIGYGAFRGMANLETVTIEGNVNIPIYAFRECAKLRTVILTGNNVTFGGGSRGMIFTNKENGDGSAITVYVANETVKERLLAADTAAKDYGGYTIVVGYNSVDSQEDLAAAVATGGYVELDAGTYTFPSSSLQEGTILDCAEGTVFDGKTGLDINGATVIGATFTNDGDYLVNSTTINGTFKDCVFTNSNGLRYCYAGENVVFENCIFDTDLYGVHFDGGADNVLFKNCTFTGFNTFGGEITKLTMEGCTFKYNGKGGYNGINLWGNSELTNCTFVFDGSASNEWVDLCNSNKTVTFTDCIVTDGTNETPIKDVVGNYGDGNTIIIDGVTVDIPNMS